MIVILALNPSINKTAVVNGLEVDTDNEVIDYRITLGNSPVYTAYTIKLLQGEPHILGFIGGFGGRYIKSFLDKNRIKSDFVWINGETKSIYNIIDSVNGTHTTMLDYGTSIEKQNLKNLKYKVYNHIKDAKVGVLSGEMPYGTDFDRIEEYIQSMNDKHTKLVIGLKGQALRKSLAYHPYAVKIDKDSIKDLDIRFNNKETMLKALYQILLDNNLHYLIYDAHNEGIYMLSKNKIILAVYNQEIEILDESYTSDAMIGGIAVGLERKYELEKLAKLAAGINYAVTKVTYPNICERKDIDYYKKKVRIIEIMSHANGWIKLSQ